jgi:hypothetical protein
LKLKFWLQNYPKKFTEIKRGNGLRPQHIEQQYIAGAAGEMVRGMRGDDYWCSPMETWLIEQEIELFFKIFCCF